MLIEGAEGTTAEQLIAILRSTPEGDPRRPFTIPPQVHLGASNSLWTGKRWPVLVEYQHKLETDYGATVQTVDFMTPEAAQRINAWAYEASDARIGQIISPASLGALTVAVVANATYFRGLWASPFSREETTPAPFYTSTRETLSVALMGLDASFGYSDASAYRAVQMPYSGDDVVAIAVLPRQDRDVNALVRDDLTEQGLERLLDPQPTRVSVRLPRFRLESNWDLKGYSMRRGCQIPFDVSFADFSAIADSGASVSEFLQTALLECDERGTEGAAATRATLRSIGYVDGSDKPVPEFRADRPFVFLVVHKPSACVLFAAIVERPEIMTR
jgi:serpin B